MLAGLNQPQDAARLALVGGEALRLALGYRTGEAFRAAARAGRVPVKLVKLEGRRGWFARQEDVQQWCATVQAQFGPSTGCASAQPSKGQGAQKGC